MRFPPLFLVPDHGTSVDDTEDADTVDPAPSSGPDYRNYSDEQLLAEREWRLRTQAGPTGMASDRRSLADDRDDRVDRITDELIRRARLRHPSARGRAV